MPIIDGSERPLCRICGVKPVQVTGASYKGKRYYSRRCSSCKGKRTQEERFWEKVEKTDSCWNWSGSKNRNGYGSFGLGGSGNTTEAHRWSYEHHIGPANGLFVCHHCDNPACVNPEHLFLGTNRDNILDSVYKDRHCRGERSPNAKLTDDAVRDLRKRWPTETIRQLAKEFGVAPNTVARAVSRNGWKHVKE